MKLIIRDSKTGEKEIDYTELSFHEIERRIKGYEKRYGEFEVFSKDFDCDESSPIEYLHILDWENLLKEKERRILHGKVKIVIRSRTPKELAEIAKGNIREYYHNTILSLERKGLVRYAA